MPFQLPISPLSNFSTNTTTGHWSSCVNRGFPGNAYNKMGLTHFMLQRFLLFCLSLRRHGNEEQKGEVSDNAEERDILCKIYVNVTFKNAVHNTKSIFARH